ncbi:centromere protein Chl4/mis15/CENP-N [Yarrowia lipolytica]|uniref:YALI0A03531p n=3 Tax=Yarrowia lipolytica TaxID=4952 RepID=Q6CHY4_YARLI|nr:YALI0A03531p [Yarrowia lipolytica CLIB122]KAB8284218.1 centromere protein Chl4/mis15/CENP-N [Yarrowia lipolytica]KAE8173131.1 centromere protein Chl4/mis15/CENP-N [Yarrowia lipolytica]KAJ8051336.1 centromere protein Chl4/mis15/CENP-N [Yarrowia lipolytica]RDW51212.1 centromere protein Chl4/mis15/CENP-N [Yarrowia lipolytica]CAG83650.1 YALI0A03531p [Yarrowia lipolytica CLIB122]|eukprot:XP_499727.1 YALI0A03531p [Yarrowia lipolytica CLIB122]
MRWRREHNTRYTMKFNGTLRDQMVLKQTTNLRRNALNKCSHNTLYNLTQLWLGSKDCLPLVAINSQDDYLFDLDALSDDEDDAEADEGIDEVEEGVIVARGGPKYEKIMDDARKELTEGVQSRKAYMQLVGQKYWNAGLNLLQLAQLDIWGDVFERPEMLVWSYSTVKDSVGKEKVPDLSIGTIATRMSEAIYPAFRCHVHAMRHPELPVIVVRVKPYDAANDDARLKPLYLVFPYHSPHVIHLSMDHVYAQTVLHAVTQSVTTVADPISLVRSSALPTRSFNTLVTTLSDNRKAASMGSWSVFATGEVDQSPLAMVKKPPAKVANSKANRIAAKFTSKKITEPLQYRSENPQSMVEFRITRNSRKVTLRMEGTDVYAGVYRMAMRGDINDRKMPAWMTGEESSTSGAVNDGAYKADK